MRKNFVGRDSTREWIVGAFMFLVLLALGYFTIIIGSDNLFRRTYPLEVFFQDVAGLRKGDSVTVHGMVIGKVADLELGEHDVRVVCALDQRLELHEGYRIEVMDTSVLGGRYLRIDKGDPAAPLVPDDELLTGEQPIDLMGEAGRMVSDLRRAFTDDGILEQLTEGLASINQVAGRLERGEGTFGALLKDDAVYRDLVEIAGNLHQVSVRANNMAAAMERGEGTLGMLLQDDDIGHELHAVLGNINAITAQLRAGEGTLGRLLSDDDIGEALNAVLGDAREISARLRAGRGTLGKLLSEDGSLYDDLEQTMAALRNIAQKVEAGEGSLGKLMADDALYRRVLALIDEIRSTVDDFRETTPLTTFTSILFGAL